MEVRSVCSQWIDGGRADASVNDQTQVKVILVFLPRWSNTYVLYHTYSCLAVYVGIEEQICQNFTDLTHRLMLCALDTGQ